MSTKNPNYLISKNHYFGKGRHISLVPPLRLFIILIALIVPYLLVDFSSCAKEESSTAALQAEAEAKAEVEAEAKANAEDLRNFVKGAATMQEKFRDVSFADVIFHATGHKILPFDKNAKIDSALIDLIRQAADSTMQAMNAADSPMQGLRRINEASRYFEDHLQNFINNRAEYSCEIPKTSEGREQRSGYPDLVVTHLASGRRCYVDPKLFEVGNKSSTLRSFYYTPKSKTNKIHYDAHHVILGFEHDGNDGAWRILSWSMSELSLFKIRLKAEFQSSNAKMYAQDLQILASESEKDVPDGKVAK